MSRISKIFYLFIALIFFICFDMYLSEVVIRKGNIIGENPIFDIVFIQNNGAAFNIFEGCKLFLILFSLAAAFGLIVYAIKNIEKLSVFLIFFCSMLVAGISVNMLERINFGYVRDYIKLNFISFPVFNISDILINIGVFSIIFIIIKRSYLKE